MYYPNVIIQSDIDYNIRHLLPFKTTQYTANPFYDGIAYLQCENSIYLALASKSSLIQPCG